MITPHAHGNAKNKTNSFLTTKKSNLTELGTLVENSQPHIVYKQNQDKALNLKVRCELCDSVIHFKCMRPVLKKLVKDKTNKNKTFACEVCS